MKMFLLLVAGLLMTPGALASGIFKCVDDQGAVTFAYAPCAEVAPQAVDSSQQEAEAAVNNVIAEIDELDSRIATLQREFRDLRLEHEQALRVTTDPDLQSRLRTTYQHTTTDMLEQLTSLKAMRGSLVENSMSLLETAAAEVATDS